MKWFLGVLAVTILMKSQISVSKYIDERIARQLSELSEINNDILNILDDDIDETGIDNKSGSQEILTVKPKVVADSNDVITETEIDEKAHKNEILEVPNKPIYKDEVTKEKRQMTELEINELNNYEGEEMMVPDSFKRGVSTSVTLWPRDSAGRLSIPYKIDASITSKDRLRQFIAKMNVELRGCNADNSDVWKEETGNRYYAKFVDSTGCSSFLGDTRLYQDYRYKRNFQPINLAFGCIAYNDGTVLHEMLHAMGFSHEQSRTDRDDFVKIEFGNIRSGREGNFRKLTSMRPASATPYDYGSVMHYGATAFTINGKQTIIPKQPGVTIGQRNGMSDTDIKEVRAVYSCPDSTNLPTNPPTTQSTKSSTKPTTKPLTTQPTKSSTKPTTKPPTTQPTKSSTKPPTKPTTESPGREVLKACAVPGSCDMRPFGDFRRNNNVGYFESRRGGLWDHFSVDKNEEGEDCRCSPWYCEQAGLCMEYKYWLDDNNINLRTNNIFVRFRGKGERQKIYYTIGIPEGPAKQWKTMKTDMSVPCTTNIRMVLRTGRRQTKTVRIKDVKLSLGKC